MSGRVVFGGGCVEDVEGHWGWPVSTDMDDHWTWEMLGSLTARRSGEALGEEAHEVEEDDWGSCESSEGSVYIGSWRGRSCGSGVTLGVLSTESMTMGSLVSRLVGNVVATGVPGYSGSGSQARRSPFSWKTEMYGGGQ